ncbi:MAG: hypothetical protein PHH58_08240 [Rhodoferax sp.]|nr:hypothetical protein [Rhodoferax sp.]
MKTATLFWRTLAVATTAVWALAAQAQASLRDELELIESLKHAPPCCVIDARSAKQRQHPVLADALIYRPGMSIVPTASVIVVGDDNPGALSVAEILAKQHPGKAIFVVRGGVTAWEFVRKALDKMPASSEVGAPPVGGTFVIPKNTCESGETLQILSSKPKAKL